MVTRGREGYIESMSARKTPRERVCERPPMDIHRVRICVREKVSACVRRGLWRVKLHVKNGCTH